jgi:hypothetical protein
METHIETQAMLGEFAAHAVRGSPTHVLTEVAAAEKAELPTEGDTDIQRCRPQQTVDRSARKSGVDEKADDLWPRKPDAGITEDEQG